MTARMSDLHDTEPGSVTMPAEGTRAILDEAMANKPDVERSLRNRITELEAMVHSLSTFQQELITAGGYYPGEVVTARALIARLRDGDR